MSVYVDKVIGVGEETDPLVAKGMCDIIIQGLTDGAVQLQYKVRPTAEMPSPTWQLVPGGSYTADTMETLFVSSSFIKVKLVGSANNAGVYCRIDREVN
jgi:hypothetical protein